MKRIIRKYKNIIMRWEGVGHIIHLWQNGIEKDIINIGNPSLDNATEQEVLSKMQRLKNGEMKFYIEGLK